MKVFGMLVVSLIALSNPAEARLKLNFTDVKADAERIRQVISYTSSDSSEPQLQIFTETNKMCIISESAARRGGFRLGELALLIASNANGTIGCYYMNERNLPKWIGVDFE